MASAAAAPASISMPSSLIPGAMPWQMRSCSPRIHSHHADLPAGPSKMCTPSPRPWTSRMCFVARSLRFVEAEQLGNGHVNLPPSNRKQSAKPSRWKGMGHTWWCQSWRLPARLFGAKQFTASQGILCMSAIVNRQQYFSRSLPLPLPSPQAFIPFCPSR